MFSFVTFKISSILFPFHFIYALLQSNPMEGLGNRLVIIIIAALIAYTVRFILIRFMNHWMMSKSSKIDKKLNQETVSSEIISNQKISFESFNADSDLFKITNHRNILVSRAKKMMKLRYITDLLILLVYLIVGLFVFEDFIFNFEFDMPFALSYFLFITLFLIWTTMGIIGYRHQFTAYKNGLFDVVAPIWKFTFAIFQSKWKFLIAIALFFIALVSSIFSLSVGDLSSGIPMLLAVLFNIYMILRLHKKARKQPNLTLLILRVFLIKKTSLFTFSKLAKFWKHFGSYFTVADPSFFKVYWKRNFKHNFPVFIIVIFLVYTQLENTGPSPFGPFIVLMILGAFIFTFWSIRKMKRSFIKNKNSLNEELTRLKNKPVNWDGTFKETPLSCFDNTWQITVETLIKTTNVVLMDLRGFSEKNKGCEFEVNLLLNRIGLERILFIGYAETMPLIKKTIEEKFYTLDVNSPNKDLKNPIATVFEVQSENNKETQAIMDLLISKSIN